MLKVLSRRNAKKRDRANDYGARRFTEINRDAIPLPAPVEAECAILQSWRPKLVFAHTIGNKGENSECREHHEPSCGQRNGRVVKRSGPGEFDGSRARERKFKEDSYIVIRI